MKVLLNPNITQPSCKKQNHQNITFKATPEQISEAVHKAFLNHTMNLSEARPFLQLASLFKSFKKASQIVLEGQPFEYKYYLNGKNTALKKDPRGKMLAKVVERGFGFDQIINDGRAPKTVGSVYKKCLAKLGVDKPGFIKISSEEI